MEFLVEQELAEQIKTFYIDYKNFFLNKGFHVYADGYNTSYC